METRPVILVVGTNCPPEIEDDFHRWYEKHVADLLESKGARRAARLKLIDEGEEKYPRYLAVYEFENRQAAEDWYNSPTHSEAIDEWNSTFAKSGAEITWRTHYELMKTWQK